MRTKLLMMTLPLTTLLSMSCQQASPPPAAGGGAPQAGTVLGAQSYDGWVKQYLADNCTSCHKPGGTATPDLTTYAGIRAVGQKSLDDMKGGTMPQGGKAAQPAIDKMQAWISANMPEHDQPVPPAPGAGGATPPAGTAATPAKMTYKSWVSTYLANNCTSCHSPQATSFVSPDMSDYAHAKDLAAKIVSAMQTNMPMGANATKATSDQIAKMQQWITDGLLEDQPAAGGGTLPGQGTDANTPPPGVLTYVTDIQPLLASHCVSCHGAGTTYDMTTLKGARDWRDLIADDVQTGRMPQTGGPLAAGDAQKFVDWVNSGSY